MRAELAPGRQLSENELADAARRQPHARARGAARLRDERLVEIVPQLGTFVSPISHDAVADAPFIREALECARDPPARRARRPSDDLEGSQANLAAQERARGRRRPRGLLPARRRASTARCATSAAARSPGRSASAPRPPQPRPAAQPARARATSREMIAEHRAVVAAVADHDPDAAEAALRHHLRMVLLELPRIRRAASRLLRGGLSHGAPPNRRRTVPADARSAVRADAADPRLRDRGRAPVQGRADRRLLPPLLRPGGRHRRRRRRARSPTTCSSPATAATASRSRAASRRGRDGRAVRARRRLRARPRRLDAPARRRARLLRRLGHRRRPAADRHRPRARAGAPGQARRRCCASSATAP